MSGSLAMLAGAVLLTLIGDGSRYLVLPTGRSHLLAGGCPAALSRDGEVVAFEAQTALAAADRNDLTDVYVYDQQRSALELASRTPDGRAAGRSWCPTISEDGQRVLFHSDARDIVADDVNLAPDLFVLDRQEGVVRRVPTGGDGDRWVNGGRISGDGRSAVFEIKDIERRTPTTVMRISLASVQASPSLVGDGYAPSVNRDGSVVAYVATDSTSGPTGLRVVSGRDVWVLGRPGSGRADGPSYAVALSANGRWAAYVSRARNLLAGRRLSGRPQVYLEEIGTGARQLVSIAGSGQEGDGRSLGPRVDEAGQTVVFASTSSNFARGDINLTEDIFCWTRDQPFARPVNTWPADDPWLEPSLHPNVSTSGRHVAFLSAHPVSDADDRLTLDVLLTRLGPADLTRRAAR